MAVVLFWPNKIQDVLNLEQDVFQKLQLPNVCTSGRVSPRIQQDTTLETGWVPRLASCGWLTHGVPEGPQAILSGLVQFYPTPFLTLFQFLLHTLHPQEKRPTNRAETASR